MGDNCAPEGSIGAGSLEDGVRGVGLAGGAGGRFLSERWPAQTPSSCSCGGRGTGAVGAGARRASEMGRTVAPPHQIDAGGDRDARNWGADGGTSQERAGQHADIERLQVAGG